MSNAQIDLSAIQDIELIPLEGMRLNNKMISLGASQEDVEALLGSPDAVSDSRHYYFDSELAFAFDNESKLEFIEFLAGKQGRLQPKIYGQYAFQIEADELYDLLQKKNNGKVDDREAAYTYGFLEISVGIFRDSTPEDVQELIEEAIEDGDPLDEDEIAEELDRALHWDTIGIGIPHYYEA